MAPYGKPAASLERGLFSAKSCQSLRAAAQFQHQRYGSVEGRQHVTLHKNCWSVLRAVRK
jgi:hypothetical protein